MTTDTPIKQIQTVLSSCKDIFNEKNIHPLITFNNEASYALQALQNNEYLLETAMGNKISLRNAFLNISSIGLSLNPTLSESYLVPREKKIFLDISYQGLITLATRSGAIEWVQADIVYKNDDFKITGFGEKPHHTYNPFSSERGEKCGCYCVAKLPSNDYLVCNMTTSEIQDIRLASKSQNSAYSPWNKFETEMWKKCVIKRAFKTWPKIQELSYFQEAIAIINEHEGIDLNQKFTEEEYEKYVSSMEDALTYYIFVKELDQENYLAINMRYMNSIKRGSKGVIRDKLAKLTLEGEDKAEEIKSILFGQKEDEKQEVMEELTDKEKIFFGVLKH